eukprot:CAMPEP_0196722676 /NCGR_PEP_ID=MMETSP1091-20130531/4974_1 /TAXON_ID=302021 /ORGANISM="Rhodomonas sp., Strain CCMP768" /LENGTH=45 /DNA_ID= /DNA_START= /DNA_END= /DNA_ORIENTATION=
MSGTSNEGYINYSGANWWEHAEHYGSVSNNYSVISTARSRQGRME